MIGCTVQHFSKCSSTKWKQTKHSSVSQKPSSLRVCDCSSHPHEIELCLQSGDMKLNGVWRNEFNGGPPADLLINQRVRDNVSGHTTRAPLLLSSSVALLLPLLVYYYYYKSTTTAAAATTTATTTTNAYCLGKFFLY